MAKIQTDRLDQLVIRAAASRKALTDAGRNLKASADVGRRLQKSIRGNLTTWLGSAAVVGLVLAKLPARKKKVYIGKNATGAPEAAAKSGMFVAFLGLVLQMARPILQKLAVEQIGIFANKYHARKAQAATKRV